MRSIIASTFADQLGKSNIAALDIASRYTELSAALRQEVVERIDDEYGLDCPQLFIVNVSLPEAVEKALDTRTSMGVIGDMNRYQQYQMGTAMTMAGRQPRWWRGRRRNGTRHGIGHGQPHDARDGRTRDACRHRRRRATSATRGRRLAHRSRRANPGPVHDRADGGGNREWRSASVVDGLDRRNAGAGKPPPKSPS